MQSRISLEHIAFYRTEIDVFFTINPGTTNEEIRRITLKRDQFSNDMNRLFQPIVQTAYSLLVEQLRELSLELETLAPFDDDILWSSDVTNLSSD